VRGVTLLELMVVVATVLVLAAFAIPGFNGYIERTRMTQAVADIGTISIQLYRWQLNMRSFPATLGEAGIAANDPWGRPYEYTRVEGTPDNQLRKDKNLHPINTDFDLYSRGPDGQTQRPLTTADSRDDVIRANDGVFIGVAANY
jgi:general secretion pathway protein G